MNKKFSCKFEEVLSEEILQKLKESFDTPNEIKWHRISYTIFNAWIYDGASITDHVLYMIEQMECLAKLGYPLHE